MSSSGIDYSAWDHIEVSDNEDETCPFVDTPSLFRMRHRARLERMAAFQQRGEELEVNYVECKRMLEEARQRLCALEDGDAEKKSVEVELHKLEKDKQKFEQMIEEYKREERRLPWNADTICKDGFDKSVLNTKPDCAEEKEKVEAHKSFAEKYSWEIKHFGMLRRWDDSQQFLSDNPHLVCEETANCLVVICVDLEIDEKPALMEQVAHQAIVLHFILDLSKALKLDPRGCFRQFFARIKTADKSYLEQFEQELDQLKERVRSCAKARVHDTMKELEEEERQKRLGPGLLDPLEVYNSLPKEMQRSFDEKNVQLLHDVINSMDPQEAKFHMLRCIDSGLWVPDQEEGDGDEEEDSQRGSQSSLVD
ncbi:hsp90 co-chaperone Cdc37-like [Synchiropus picturatus]